MNKRASLLPNEQLRRERQRRGWSREYVAEQIGAADPKTIGRWERGNCFPSAYFLQKLCALFALLPQDLGLVRDDHHGSDVVSSEAHFLSEDGRPISTFPVSSTLSRSDELLNYLECCLEAQMFPVLSAPTTPGRKTATLAAVPVHTVQELLQHGGVVIFLPFREP